MRTQQCQWCKEIKDETDFHWKWVNVERLKVCKECRKLQSKRYRDRSKEKRYAYNRQYAITHKEDIAEYERQYHNKNKDKLLKRYQDNREIISENFVAYYHKNREKLLAKKREWSKIHRDRNRYYNKQHDARKRGADIVDFAVARNAGIAYRI